MSISITAKRRGDIRKVNQSILRAQRKVMNWIVNYLKSDILRNRLSKTRTGDWVRKSHKRGVSRAGNSGTRPSRFSGPPIGTQVLSKITGHLARNIFALVEQRGDDIVVAVGTNVFYGAIHEQPIIKRKGPRRSWLRPALKDAEGIIVDRVGKEIAAQIKVDYSTGLEK